MNERILTVLNKSEDEQYAEINIPSVYQIKSAIELPTTNDVVVNNNVLQISIPPIGYKIFKLK
jgi:hypothetical protein